MVYDDESKRVGMIFYNEFAIHFFHRHRRIAVTVGWNWIGNPIKIEPDSWQKFLENTESLLPYESDEMQTWKQLS